MRVVYESINGKIFYDMNECLEYEKTLDFKMYDENGRTDDANQCFVVDIIIPEAAESFIEVCETIGTSYDGIKLNTSGVYVWNSIDQKYFPLNSLAEKALKEYFKDIETQE